MNEKDRVEDHDKAPDASEKPAESTNSKPAPAAEKVGPEAPSFWWSGYGPFSY
jgi:hypothetical protein